MSLEPAIAALAGLVILSEQLTLLQWVAIGLVVIASIGSSFTPRKAIEMGV
jgi:inner membrane transporter RhtA